MIGVEMGHKVISYVLYCLGVALFGQLQLTLPTPLVVLEIIHKTNYYIITMQGEQTISSFIPKDHPYYALLTKNDHQLSNIFKVDEKDLWKEPNTPFPLKVYGRQNTNNIGATFLYFYTLPIKAEEMLNLMQDFDFQKQIDKNIDEFKVYKQLNLKDTSMLFLSYKKIFIVMPRYFIYVRFTFRVGNQIWTVSRSDPESETIKEKTKGEIVECIMRLKQVQGGCEVSVYSLIDMKMKLKFEMAFNSGQVEITKYLKNIYGYIKNGK